MDGCHTLMSIVVYFDLRIFLILFVSKKVTKYYSTDQQRASNENIKLIRQTHFKSIHKP